MSIHSYLYSHKVILNIKIICKIQSKRQHQKQSSTVATLIIVNTMVVFDVMRLLILGR